MDINLAFCRQMLKTAKEQLTRAELKSFNSDDTGLTWTGASHRRDYFFEWLEHDTETAGETYVWEGRADNAYDARYKALSYWLEHHAEKFRRAPE